MVAVATSSDMNTRRRGGAANVSEDFNISGRNDMGISNNGESENHEIGTLGNKLIQLEYKLSNIKSSSVAPNYINPAVILN